MQHEPKSSGRITTGVTGVPTELAGIFCICEPRGSRGKYIIEGQRVFEMTMANFSFHLAWAYEPKTVPCKEIPA